ncbi:MAG: RNA polymerase sigma factor [PVC group bacterium]
MERDRQTITDEALAAQFKFGRDMEAFNSLHKRYRVRILNYLCRCLGDYQRAEELTQEVFMKVYGGIPRLRSIENISRWIYKIAHNFSRMEYRKRKRRKLSMVSLDSLFVKNDGEEINVHDFIANHKRDPDRIFRQKHLEVKIQTALMQLSPELREILVLCVIQGASYLEAAETLNIARGTVSTRLIRARKKFNQALGIKPGQSASEVINE